MSKKLGTKSEPPPIVLRHSQLKDFRQCPLKEKLSWREGWHDPSREAGGARALGTSWHLVMAAHYLEIQRQQQAGYKKLDQEALELAVGSVFAQIHSEDRENILWMYDAYVEYWGIDPTWRIIDVERTLQVAFHDEDDQPLHLFDPSMGVIRPVLYEWTSDVLIYHREYRAEMVVDHKSTAQPLGQQDIDLDDQFGLYTVAWRRLGRKIRGQLINQVKTKKLVRAMSLAERHDRKPSIRTEVELRNIELDAVDTIHAMFSERNLRRPYSNPDPRTCGWKCDFKEPHLRLRRTRDWSKLPNVMRSFGLEQGATHGKGPISDFDTVVRFRPPN